MKFASMFLALAAALIPALPGRTEPLADRGRAFYAAHCARCHGEDGADLSYPGVKSLVNVTRRRTAEEIAVLSRGFAGVAIEGEDARALVAHLASFQTPEYANQQMLAEPGWLAENSGKPGLRVIDMRPEAAYGAGHIPGAVSLAEGLLRTAEDKETYLPRPEALAAALGKAGIDNRTHVIAYDDQGGRSAARLWYVLSAFGHTRFSILNGGWQRWVADKRPVSTEVPTVPAAAFKPVLTPILSCPSSELLARKPGVVVLDTRSAMEFAGNAATARSGHVPGAVHVEWKENVGGSNLTFKPAAELLKLYESKGVTKDKEIVTYCQSGGRAAHTLFTLKLLGYPRVKVYYGSFLDYSARPEAPLEKKP